MPEVKIEVRTRVDGGKTVYDIWQHATESNGAMSSKPFAEAVRPSTCTAQIAQCESQIEGLKTNIETLRQAISMWEDAKAQIAAAEAEQPAAPSA